MNSGVYAIRNIVNGKCYIGSTSNFKNRKAIHFSSLRHNRHHSSIFQRAWNKYGEGKFIFEILEYVIPEDFSLMKEEQLYLDLFNPEYNISKMADSRSRLGLRNSPEHCARISAGTKGRLGVNKGKKFSEEHKRKISESHAGGRPVGYHHSKESKEKMRLKSIGRKPRIQSLEEKNKRSETKTKYWKELSDDEKNKIIEKISYSQRTPDRKGICVVCLDKFTYRPNGKKKIKTCGKECLSELRRINLKKRTDANPEANKQESLKRRNQIYSSSSDL